jgi:hypothetical protein
MTSLKIFYDGNHFILKQNGALMQNKCESTIEYFFFLVCKGKIKWRMKKVLSNKSLRNWVWEIYPRT